MSSTMKQHEYWRLEYRTRRYMEHLEPAGLEQRARDVFQNLLVLTEDGKIGLPANNNQGRYWMGIWTHIQEEFFLRFGPYPAGFPTDLMKTAHIPDPRPVLAKQAARLVKQNKFVPGSFLVKYGKFQHLQEILKAGILRICPADFYNDPSLNPAIGDNELEISVEALPSETIMTLIDKTTKQPKGTVKPISNVVITSKSSTNYYVCCLSEALEARLFVDFDADACLVITKPKDLLETLFQSFDKALPGWDGHASPIIYIDPLRTRTGSQIVFRSTSPLPE